MPPRQGTPPHGLSTADAVCRFIAGRRKAVIAFAGFGELGYEEERIVERIVPEVVRGRSPEQLIVACGTLLRAGGQDGIARVYEVAKGMGIETVGIHPGIALDFADTHYVSPFQDHAFFVPDRSWGGFLDADRRLSPTLDVILRVSDELVVIGGGKHAADELLAFSDRDRAVQYFPASMHTQTTLDWCRRDRVEIADMRGAAYAVWESLRSR